MAMICTVCGAENMEGSIYCEDCGARLPVSGGAAAPTPPPAPAFTPAPAQPEAAEPTREAFPAVDAAAPPSAPAGSGAGTTCGTCGAANGPGEMYCEDCGAALGDSPSGAGGDIPTPNIGDVPPPITAPPAPAVPTTPAQAVAAAVAGKPRLESPSNGQTFVLAKDENAVGRRSPVDGIFPEVDLTEADIDSYISRRHGKIIMGEQGPVYEDLGSSNGSFHNGVRLQQGVQAVLREGDRLRLGKTELVYHSN